jgi:transposase
MANHLTMALIDTIHTLRQRGWSQRRIARELGIDRETVARHLQTPPPDSKPAMAPSGSSAATTQPKPAIAPPGSDQGVDRSPQTSTATPPGADARAPLVSPPDPGPGRPSDCLPWRDVIVAKLDLGLSAQRIFQDLTAEHGYTGSYYSVRRFVCRLEQTTPLPFRRMECGPGEEAQVDFGLGAPVVTADGRRRRPYVLRIVLSHSRKAYSEAVYRQSTDAFLGCVENAFWTFGGVVQRLVLDNLKAAVTKADWFDPEIHPKIRACADYYGVALLPTRPYTPRHKGKVERGVDYVQENALKGRTFSSLHEQNAFLRDWEQAVADTRVHGTTRQQVGKRFAEVERPALVPLPAERFPSFHEAQRTVHRDGHVEVAKAYYSLPPEYLGRRVWVRWDGHLVRIFNDRLEAVAVHVQQEPGRFSTHASHIASEKVTGAERGAAWLLGRIAGLGTQALRWAEAMLARRGVEGVRVLQGLLALAGRHDAASIDRACGVAAGYDEYRLRTVRALIGRDVARQEPLPFLDEHPLIRSLADYEQLVHTFFQKEP